MQIGIKVLGYRIYYLRFLLPTSNPTFSALAAPCFHIQTPNLLSHSVEDTINRIFVAMIMRWLVDGLALLSHKNKPTGESRQVPNSFERFSDLPTELRLQIWEYYFDVPRIHVLYQGPSKLKSCHIDPPVAYVELVARTNHKMPASLQFAAAVVSREAHEVFSKTFDPVHMGFMGLPSKRLKDSFEDQFRGFTDPEHPDRPLHMSNVSKDLLRSTPQFTEFFKNPTGEPRHMVMPGVHINWGRDLLYLTDGADVNCEMLRRVCNGPFAGKLRRVAILIHDSITFEGWRRFYGPSVDFTEPSAKLEQVTLVVRLSDSEQSSHAKLERDEFGFVAYDSAVQGQKGGWDWMQNMKRIERRFVYVTQVLGEAFPGLEKHRIKWAVDVDYTHQNTATQYSRKPRHS
ncbi:hypothetical protein F5Y19DRAFT_431271 [Xylariaceae sp. FL1651]|nr:hypothetical protein F5Y19DRAFT_431271 [Xylariaceae sp. FL1651]